MREEILNKALQLTGELEIKTNELFDRSEDIENVQAKMKLQEAAILADISVEVNGDNKPKYSNEATRNAELAIRRAEDGTHSNLREILKNLSHDRSRLSSEAAKITSQVSLYKAFLNGSSA